MQGERPSAGNIPNSRRRSFGRSDEEIIDQLKRSHRVAGFMLLGLLVCLVASVVLVFGGPAIAVPRAVGEYLAAATLIVWALAVLRFSRRINPPPEANEERFLRKRIDAFQGTWRWLTVYIGGIAFTTTFAISGGLQRTHSLHPPLAQFAGSIFVFVILLYSFGVFYGPGYLSGSFRIINDELARALHARAFKAGYLALMVMLGGVLLVALYRPALIIPALCWVLFAGFALPTLYYVILQWRTGSGD